MPHRSVPPDSQNSTGHDDGPPSTRNACAGRPQIRVVNAARAERGPPGRSSMTDHDLTDLKHRRQIGVIGDIGEDFLGVRTEA